MKRFFGETVLFEENEKEDTKNYLLLWKKYLLRNLLQKHETITVIDEEFSEHDPLYLGPLNKMHVLSFRICVEVKDKYEL